jgi:hypothetical protein
VEDVLLPTLTTWGRPVRTSRMQREVFSPRVLSFVGTVSIELVLQSK